ncbi:DNA-binding transcriptional regulator, PadR family [Actinopolymorpha cephalotaxi]|uniref:DNA-binding PadR family transcriptional regulator n=1 Tax=Actinopolymorpha cephalotaxi TaxID=504797 RepID=A0A1I3BWM5_9ACTN|nr:PadR family transcriptional regulator [Actinopolymorpha cephalotaxi]NYH86323.1 DNA-binding PadR family transcriptional regulator [Actinopolymorpha cephalotaxi]SFH66590.1 DNA-binding transcriptional regulator, PadR family [Actinopolymorpha cephalotaxi]
MSIPRTLLGLLEDEPSYGYTLKQRYDELFARTKNLAFGQVYSTLARLERDGFASVVGVESGEGPERRRYAITDDGVVELDTWIRTPEPATSFAQSVLFVKTTLALLSGRSPSDVLDAQRRVHLARMRELTASRAESDDVQLLAVDYEIAHLDADLRWIEETGHRLEQRRGSRRARGRS